MASPHVVAGAHDFTHLDPEVLDGSAAGGFDCSAGRTRDFSRELIGTLRTVDIHEPEAGEELLGFGEDTVGDRLPVLAYPDEFRLDWRRKSPRANQLARFAQLLGELVHEGHVRLENLLRPAHVLLVTVCGGVHDEHVFHDGGSVSRSAARHGPLSWRSRSRARDFDIEVTLATTDAAPNVALVVAA